MESTGNANEIRKPYKAKVIFEFGEEAYFKVDGEFSIKGPEGLVLRFKPLEKDKSSDDRRKWQVSTGGFATEKEAAYEGDRIVNMLHWMSITDILHPHIISPNLDRWSRADGSHVIFTIPKSAGSIPEDPAPVEGYYHLFSIHNNDAPEDKHYFTVTGSELYKAKDIVAAIGHAHRIRGIQLSEEIKLAMELYSAALHETTERATFIGLVSSLEPLANQQDFRKNERYGERVRTLIDHIRDKIDRTEDIGEDIRTALKNKVKGDLHRESVSQALKRLLRTYFSEDSDDFKVIVRSYNMRSKMLHEGKSFKNLDEEIRMLKSALRRLFAKILGLPLSRDP